MKQGGRGKGQGAKIKEKAKKIKLLILDVDGVMTDGGIILDNNGNEFKRFHVRDGHGIKMAQRVGIIIAFLTGRESNVVSRRASELGVTDIFQGRKEKIISYRELLNRYNLKDEEVAFIGDDVIDIPIMRCAGLSIAVSDAEEDVIKIADWVTKRAGGRGAVREAIEFILKSQGKWKELMEKYNNNKT
ncbi:MAG: HAD-IIIA family hydrolase [Nitrospirota bacterium]